MKPEPRDIARAIDAFRQMNWVGFPTGDLGMEILQRSLERMVGTRDQLLWLVETACNNMRRFSLPELRGIFCSRFPPADGQYAASETPGFTPDDAMASVEAAYHQRESEDFDRKLKEWKREAKLLRGSEQAEPFELPAGAVKMLPAPANSKQEKQEKQEKPRISSREAQVQLDADLMVSKLSSRSPEQTARMIAELEKQLETVKGDARAH